MGRLGAMVKAAIRASSRPFVYQSSATDLNPENWIVFG